MGNGNDYRDRDDWQGGRAPRRGGQSGGWENQDRWGPGERGGSQDGYGGYSGGSGYGNHHRQSDGFREYNDDYSGQHRSENRRYGYDAGAAGYSGAGSYEQGRRQTERGFSGYSPQMAQSQQANRGRDDEHAGHEHHDPRYHDWRQRQMEQFDADYRAYRQERQSKFDQDFDEWRANRQPNEDENEA